MIYCIFSYFRILLCKEMLVLLLCFNGSNFSRYHRGTSASADLLAAYKLAVLCL